MDVGTLVETYPILYHMAHQHAWPGIQRYGLLSTTALLDLYEIHGLQRNKIESQQRLEIVELSRDDIGQAFIRDNLPLSPSSLEECLMGMKPSEYYRLLNGKVFFWLSEQRLDTLLNARAYRNDPQLILRIDTASIVERYEDQVTLSPINSGAAIMNLPKRGAFTFKRIADYDFETWKRKRGPSKAVAELAIDQAVPDIMDHLIHVQKRFPDGRSEVILS